MFPCMIYLKVGTTPALFPCMIYLKVGTTPSSSTSGTIPIDISCTETKHTPKAPWASTVHVRALAEQDAHAGRHYNGFQEVDRARAGPRGLAEAHLSNDAVPPRDTARRNVTYVPPAKYCMFLTAQQSLSLVGFWTDTHVPCTLVRLLNE